MKRPPRVPDIGVIALVPEHFDTPWQSRHQILTRLSHYYHVVWVNPAWGNAPWRRRTLPASGGSRGFVVYTPEPWLPALRQPVWVARTLERARLARARRILVKRGCQKIVLSLWRPGFERALDAVPHDLSVYHIDDEYTFARIETAPDPRELRIIKTVDVVTVHSPGLMQSKGHVSPKTVFIPNGVDYSTYAKPAPEPADLSAIPHPRIGYTGYIKPQLDWELLRELIVSHPEWNFVFVGPERRHAEVRRMVESLHRQPNAYFLGLKTVDDLAAYPQHFDVCILPYRADDYGRYVYPLKLHEYLASGRPVVGMRIRTLEDFANLVSLASTPVEWSVAIVAALHPSAHSEGSRLARQVVARLHDWREIVYRLACLIASELGRDDLDRLQAD